MRQILVERERLDRAVDRLLRAIDGVATDRERFDQRCIGQRQAVHVGLADGVRFEIMDRRSSDDALILGDEVLIGQTLLEKMDLLVDCTRQRLVPAHQEGPVNKLK